MMRRLSGFALVFALMLAGAPAAGQEVAWEATALQGFDPRVRTLFVAANGTVFAGTDGVLLRSANSGEGWEAVGPVGVNDLVELPSGVLVAVGREGGHRSGDGGQTWEQVLAKPLLDECGDFMQFTYVVLAAWGEVFAGSIEEDVASGGCKIDGHMYRSEDGRDWSRVTGTTFGDSQAALPVSPDTLISGGDGGSISLYFNISTNQQISRKFIVELRASVTALVMDNNRHVYAATGPSIRRVGEGTGIYRSMDNGETWQQINTGLTDTTITDLALFPSGTLLAATLHGGVHRSTDGGDAWHAINSGLPSLRVTALAVTADGFVFAGTDQGIYRSTSAIATASEQEPVLPARFVLGQNYPNPFNPTTTIRYELPEASAVRLAVYDVLGREVAVLVEGYRAAGAHEAVFEAAALPSGLYVYRLEAAGHLIARVMSLVR